MRRSNYTCFFNALYPLALDSHKSHGESIQVELGAGPAAQFDGRASRSCRGVGYRSATILRRPYPLPSYSHTFALWVGGRDYGIE